MVGRRSLSLFFLVVVSVASAAWGRTPRADRGPEERRVEPRVLLRTWRGADDAVVRQELVPCMPYGGTLIEPETSGVGTELVLEDDAATRYLARLAPPDRTGALLCSIESVSGPNRIRVDIYEHASVVRVRTAGRTTSLAVEWRDGACPHVV